MSSLKEGSDLLIKSVDLKQHKTEECNDRVLKVSMPVQFAATVAASDKGI